MLKNSNRLIGRLLAFVMLTSVCLSNVSFTGVSAADGRKVDVWDMGAVAEANTDVYNNNVALDFWDNNENLKSGKLAAAGTAVSGDFSLVHNANDRVYYNGTKSYAATWTYKALSFGDYTSDGCAYFNGTGGETRRHVLLDNVVAGDRVRIYGFFSNATAGENIHFKAVNGTQDSVDFWDGSKTDTGCYSDFIAEESGQYKLYWDTDNGGKPIFHRVVRYPAVNVSVNIDKAGYDVSNYGVKFLNQETKTEYVADTSADGKTATAVLPSGYTYTALLSGVTGYGFTNTTKYVEASVDKTISGVTADLVVEPKVTYTASGSIEGFAADYDLSKLVVNFMADPDSTSEDAVAVVDAKTMSYSVVLDPDVTYTVALDGVNDYEVVDGGSFNFNKNTNQNIKVATKAVYDVIGQIYVLNNATTKSPAQQYSVFDGSVSAVSFENMADGYTYAGTVAGADYSVVLRDGEYKVAVTCEGYTTNSHVVVAGGKVVKNLLVKSTAAVSVPYSNTVYVGDGVDVDYHYATVYDAVNAINAMTPQPASEADRITVYISEGEYVGQSTLTAPYVSFVSAGGSPVISNYYGINYEYYSVDNTGYYNPENAFDKYTKAQPTRWGAALRLNKANYFKAEGIEFKNTFNYLVTDEEVADGVAPMAGSGMPARTYGTDVTTKAATERGSAIAIDADYAEFKACSFLGSQDTLYTGSGNHAYFNDCFISGNTDYIFGDGDMVFDGCELNWYGYSDSSNPGHIAVNKDTAANGYLFRNCTVTYNPEHVKGSGDFGRPWGQGAKVKFVNTQLTDEALIIPAGWASMSGATPEKANYLEYNTTYNNTAVDTSKRVTGVVTEAPVVDVKAYFGEWTPSYFVVDGTGTPAFATAPYITSNDDLNLPYPGNTLTVNYSLGNDNALDNSVITWYAVAADGSETVIKVSSARVSNKLYLEEAQNIGSYIKAVVTPGTVDGRFGVAGSVQTENTVQDGFNNPDNPNVGPVGDGINVYLVGDSTVKDYSANAINNTTTRSEGAWGEFLQDFFNEKYVTVYDHAQGGRSARSFINDGRWDKIKSTLKQGDYVFIQFGHNDCSNSAGYLEERYVPLAIDGVADVTTDANGNKIYPTYVGNKSGAAGTSTTYTGEWYQYNDGTYKGFLNTYIEEARALGAIPVLCTPVSRMYYDSEGKIKTHHDSDDTTTGTYVSSGDAYVQAVFQLGEETNTPVVDMFQFTKDQFEAAYAACGSSYYGSQIMFDNTHNNKVGGVIDAAIIAKYIQQEMNNSLSPYVVMPAGVNSPNANGEVIFTINNKGKLDINTASAETDAYWTNIGQTLIDEIANYGSVSKVELGDVDLDGTVTANDSSYALQHVLNPNALNLSADALKAAEVDGTEGVSANDSVCILQKVLVQNYEFPAA